MSSLEETSRIECNLSVLPLRFRQAYRATRLSRHYTKSTKAPQLSSKLYSKIFHQKQYAQIIPLANRNLLEKKKFKCSRMTNFHKNSTKPTYLYKKKKSTHNKREAPIINKHWQDTYNWIVAGHFFFCIACIAYLSFYHDKAINALYELA